MKPHECTPCLYFIWAWRAPLWVQGQDLWPQSCFKFKRPCSKSQVLLSQLNPFYLAQNDINLNTTLQLSLVCMRWIVCIKVSNIWVEDNPKVPWSLNTKISLLSQRKKLACYKPTLHILNIFPTAGWLWPQSQALQLFTCEDLLSILQLH